MNSLKLIQNVCRICLEEKVELNWNHKIFEFSGWSYKDCYYKYTKLDEPDEDHYPTNLCKKCAIELKNAHELFQKALDTFNILRGFDTKYVDIDISNDLSAYNSDGIQDIGGSYSAMGDERLIELEVKICLSPFSEDEEIIEAENSVNNSKEITYEVKQTSAEISLEELAQTNKENRNKRTIYNSISSTSSEELSEIFENLPTTNKGNKAKKYEILVENSLEEKTCVQYSEIKNSKNTKKNVKKSVKKMYSTSTLLEENQSESCDAKSTILENNPAKKRQKKRLLMCSYCSLKVHGVTRLKEHEATHIGNRERKCTCPHCGLKLYTEGSLHLHMKIHDKNRKRNHKCEFCEKSFFNKGALNVHRRIHLGLMVKCQICKKEFYRQIDLKTHLLKHSGAPREKNIGKNKFLAECQYCNEAVFTSKLKEHVAIHLNQPQMKCKICNKNFFTRQKCTSHLRRFHLKNLSEYDEFIHYFVDRDKPRLSNLLTQQQLVVQTVAKPNL